MQRITKGNPLPLYLIFKTTEPGIDPVNRNSNASNCSVSSRQMAAQEKYLKSGLKVRWRNAGRGTNLENWRTWEFRLALGCFNFSLKTLEFRELSRIPLDLRELKGRNFWDRKISKLLLRNSNSLRNSLKSIHD